MSGPGDIDMDARLADMPVMAARGDAIDAALYNLWRRARARWGGPMRLDDLGLKQMEMILTDRYWVVVDTIQHDCPIVAWMDFDDSDRSAIHEPIPCRILYYHFAASAVRGPALKAMGERLAARLKADEL